LLKGEEDKQGDEGGQITHGKPSDLAALVNTVIYLVNKQTRASTSAEEVQDEDSVYKLVID